MVTDAGFLALIDSQTGQPVDGAPIGALLTAHALATPHAPALTIAGATLDFTTLDAAANRRARLLAEDGLRPNDIVILALPNSVDYYVTCFALWKVGATPCQVSSYLTDPELEALVALARPKLVVLPDPGRIDSAPVFRFDHDREAALSSAPLQPIAGACFRIATSGGSTGRPKLIVDPNAATWGPDKEAIRRPSHRVLLNPAPLYHSAPFAMMLLALCQGSHVVDMGRFDASSWLQAVAQRRIDWAYLVPTMMARIAKLPAEETSAADLSSLELLLHMAAPCPPWVKRWWIDRIGADAVWEVYGGTERIGATTIGGTEWLVHPGSVGAARSGQEIVILDEAGEPVAKGEVGEIYFRKSGGPGSTYRYIGADARIRGDLESFGDMGWLDEGGYLFLADRRTDMIVSGGVNIYPAEIEGVIERMKGVLACAVIGLPDPDLGSRVHAIVQRSLTAALTEAEVLAGAEAQLSRFKLPRSVEITTEPLRNDAGKMRRHALRADRVEFADRFNPKSPSPGI